MIKITQLQQSGQLWLKSCPRFQLRYRLQLLSTALPGLLESSLISPAHVCHCSYHHYHLQYLRCSTLHNKSWWWLMNSYQRRQAAWWDEARVGLTINFHPSQVIQRSAVDKYSSATLRNYRQLNINCEKMCVHLKSWLANVKLGTQLISRWPKYVLTTSYFMSSFKERRFQRRNCLNNPSSYLSTLNPLHTRILCHENQR